MEQDEGAGPSSSGAGPSSPASSGEGTSEAPRRQPKKKLFPEEIEELSSDDDDTLKYVDEIALDYATVRVPYEQMQADFRNGQKELEKLMVKTQKAAAMIGEKVRKSKSPMEKAELKLQFEYLIKQVTETKAKYEQQKEEQLKHCDTLMKRCDGLLEEVDIPEGTPHREKAKLQRLRHYRYIIWHLIRCGYTVAARKIMTELNLEHMVDIEIFEKVHEIKEEILKKNIDPCLAWIEHHRSKLKKIGSKLEVAIRQVVVVDMVELGQIFEAVQYVKKYLTPIAKLKFPEELKKTMGMIACTLEESRQRNPDFHREDRWEQLGQQYMKQVYEVYQFSSLTAFSALAQLGIAVHKTPSCRMTRTKDRTKVKCLCCRPDIWPIAKNLPYCKVENSRILCSISNELCDDDENFPYLLPSGHVIGKKAMEKLRREEGKIWDPVNKVLADESEFLRLYFL